MQNFNYHTHTYRCGHARGTEEEMIEAAIQAGFKTIGISEHLAFEGWIDSNSRPSMKSMEEYLETMKYLKVKYADKIIVRTGFESEFFEDRIDYLKSVKERCDYLICGQHSKDRESLDYYHFPYYGDDYIMQMAEQVCCGIELGLFNYVAHPDYFLLGGCELTKGHHQALTKIACCAKKHGVVVELNIKGTRYGKQNYQGIESYRYPNSIMAEILGDVGTLVCFGYDAHAPNQLLRQDVEAELRELFKPFHLNYAVDLKL